jgi:Ni,Fe-hydrogenase I cytochrome b subunit
MFESLDEQMKLDEAKQVSNSERMMRWLFVVVISVLIFGGLYFGVHFMNS